ncbi:MAG: 4Fe-4S dicluster domain-containing protein [Candidatus Omnitrophota bacterium]|nr:4Fe-4S dicluster domain-containing protein [Candidatus Omnitrophota bacterium]
MKKGIIVVDADKCVACRTCELQCAIAHSKSKKLETAICEIPLSQARVKVESVGKISVPLQCRHCEDAPCVKICPTKAMVKDAKEGIVQVKHELCTKCKWCILACPFGVIHLDQGSQAITKCDLCFERLKKDQLPACVVGCKTNALKFKSAKEISKGKKKKYLVQFKKEKN